VKVEPIAKTTPAGSEKTVLLPEQVNRKGKEIKIPPNWEFEFDLSVLPKDITILDAAFEAFAVSKEVMAKTLGNKNAHELAPLIIQTPFYGSRIQKAGSDRLGAYDSTCSWQTDGLYGVLARVGGTGGAGVYSLKEPGWDRWNITGICKEAINNPTPILSFYIGFTEGDLIKFGSPTIFDNRIMPESFVYSGYENEDKKPRLIVVYQEK